MKLRTYLLLSYLALIVILGAGAWFIDELRMHDLTKSAINIADRAVNKVTEANVHHSDHVLTQVGEYIVKDKAEDVARELGYLLGGKKTYDYAKLRQDPFLRKIATQSIYTPDGPAGYVDLYDKNGYILFHPDKDVEGRNQLGWEKEYPETTELIRRSFTTDLVKGYFTFFDKNKRERQRFSVRVHVPGTPFIVAAIVNLDEFFFPAQQRMRDSCRLATGQARQQILEHYATLNREVMLAASLPGWPCVCWVAFRGCGSRAPSPGPFLVCGMACGRWGRAILPWLCRNEGCARWRNWPHSFNQLGEQLIDYIAKRDFIRDTFGRYVTQEVVTKLLASKEALEMGGETREVSLIMSDLRGFTAIIAEMEPEQVITFLNRYLSKMIEILLDNRAVIDEILGDGILAFFGAPEPLEDHPARAVACALLMQAAMDEINAENQADGMPLLAMGIGVNTGTVVVGNIGSERRTKYSVVGSDVNFASRMEGFALAGQVLISAATYNRVKDLVEVRNVLQVEMKGMPGRATLYDVQGIGAPYNIRLPDKSEAPVKLPEEIRVQLHRLKDKIVTGPPGQAWVTHLCDTAALVNLEGVVREWEDVRLTFLNDKQEPVPGHIYGKITQVKPSEEGRSEVLISFTSVPPEIYRKWRQNRGAA